MNSKPDTIKVSASHKEEIIASRADLYITVRGSSVVSGDQALKKAKEVNKLVEELTGFGLSPEAIHLQGVHIESSSSALLKSSSATYRLRIECDDLAQLTDLLDIISSQKNATLERIQWKFEEEQARERGLMAALEKAKAKAGKIAGSMGVSLLGVYDFIENNFDEERPYPPFPAQAVAMRSKGTPAPEPSLSMDIHHGKNITVSVDIWYRVSEF